MINFYYQKILTLKLWQLLLLVSILVFPAYTANLWSDDNIHFILLNNLFPLKQFDDISFFNLFSFVNDDPYRRVQLQNYSILAWWISADFTWAFWRPLSELSHYIDYVWMKDYPILMHTHSVVIFLLITVSLKKLFSKICNTPQEAKLSTIIFALSGCHAMVITWLSNRSALLALLFGILALIIHIQTQKKPLYYIASITFVCLALLSAEMGISIGFLLFSYAIFLDKRGWRRGFISITPYLVPALGWIYIYTSNNMGVSALGEDWFYLDPLADPKLFLTELLIRIPVITFSQLTPIPAEIIYSLKPHLRQPVIFLSYLFLLLLPYTFKNTSMSKQFYFFYFSGLMSIIPIAASHPQDRNLVFVSLSFAGLIALFIIHLLADHKNTRSDKRKMLYKSLASLLIVLHLFLSPILLPIMSFIPKSMGDQALRRALSFDEINYTKKESVVIFGGDALSLAYLTPTLLVAGKTLPKSIWNITQPDDRYTVTPISEYELLIKADTQMFVNSLKILQDITLPFSSGQTIKLTGLSIHIVSIGDNGFPQQLLLTFDDKLSDIHFVEWHHNRYERIDITRFKGKQ